MCVSVCAFVDVTVSYKGQKGLSEPLELDGVLDMSVGNQTSPQKQYTLLIAEPSL